MRRYAGVFLVVLAAGIMFSITESHAQGNRRRLIQLSGMVLSQQDSLSGIPGVHVYVPKAGRGTSTNPVGFYSMPVLAGDSIVIIAVGFTRQHYIVPTNVQGDFLTIVVELSADNM